MSVERSNNLHTLFAAVLGLDFILSFVVEIALKSHGLEAPLILKLIEVLASPRERTLVLGGDLNRRLLQGAKASGLLCLLILTLALLILSQLVDKDCTAS